MRTTGRGYVEEDEVCVCVCIPRFLSGGRFQHAGQIADPGSQAMIRHFLVCCTNENECLVFDSLLTNRPRRVQAAAEHRALSPTKRKKERKKDEYLVAAEGYVIFVGGAAALFFCSPVRATLAGWEQARPGRFEVLS